MRYPARVALGLVAATALFTGCGSTLYDAHGVPQVACTTAEKPLACGNECFPATAEGDAQCGPSCLDCTGANKLSADPAAVNFCNRNDPALANHACDFDCAPGLVKNVLTNRCDCADGLQVRCGVGAACSAQTLNSCGDACLDCADTAVFPVHAHGVPACDDVNRVCGFACDPTFVKTTAGDACVCPANAVACGAGGTTCVGQTLQLCGSSCTNCQLFPVNAANGASAVCAGDGAGVTAATPCNLSCPAAKPRKFFDSVAGRWDCGAPVCSPGQSLCGDGVTCHVTSDIGACGQACTNCLDPTQNPLPAQGTAACLPSGTDFACSFTCPVGTLKQGSACVTIAAPAIAGAAPLPSSVALGADHTCVITSAGGVKCWGSNAVGQVGPGAPLGFDQLTQVDVPLPAGQTPIYLAAGATRTCVVLQNPAAVPPAPATSVSCWGDGSTAVTGVSGVGGAFAVAVGAGHSCAIIQEGGVGATRFGTVKCWGANDKGQLGQLPITPLPTLAQAGNTFPTLSNIDQISTQLDHTCARTITTNVVSCWGANDTAQTGQAPSPSVPTPTAVPGVGAAGGIAAGGTHSCASGVFNGLNPGTYCWGDDHLSQLGDKPRPVPTAPIVVAVRASLTGGKGVASTLVGVGRAHTCDTKVPDPVGNILCGGANDFFQVGDNVRSASLPQGVDIAIGSTIDLLVLGGDRSCALANGILKCWGANAHGQLGNGSSADVPAVAPLGPVSPSPQ